MRHSVWQKWTGANLVGGVGIQAVRGIPQNDPRTITGAYHRLFQEIRKSAG